MYTACICQTSMQVLWCGAVGDANRRGALQGCGFLCYHLGSWQQQSASACARELSRQLQTAAEAVLVSVAGGWWGGRRWSSFDQFTEWFVFIFTGTVSRETGLPFDRFSCTWTSLQQISFRPHKKPTFKLRQASLTIAFFFLLYNVFTSTDM